MENCFIEYEKIRSSGTIVKNVVEGLTSGIEGLIKILNSNKISSDIVKSYSKILLKDRLDILLSPATNSFQEYVKITPYYSDILQSANRYYDLIFVDLNKKMPAKDKVAILQMSNIVVMNLTQKEKVINDFMTLKEQNDFYQRNNVMIAIGRYDKDSKYNKQNVTRYLKERKVVSAVPYNILFTEKCSEGNIIDYILSAKNVTDETDTNFNFIKEVKEISQNIIFKLQELQMKL